MPSRADELPTPAPATTDVGRLREVDRRCDEFEAAWRAGGAPECEAFAVDADRRVCGVLLRELLIVEWQYRGGPDDAEAVRDALAGREPLRAACRDAGFALDDALTELHADRAVSERPSHRGATDAHRPGTPVHGAGPSDGAGGLHLRCPHCQNGVEVLADAPLDEITCQSCGSSFGLVGKADQALAAPPRVGRFELEERLGVGGFGAVWKARDPELDRHVAVKVPRRGQLPPHEVELFLREARTAAQLAHPNIVPVHEVGRDGASVFIVSELIHGEPMSETLARERPQLGQAIDWLATIADAVHCAHERGVVHRDLKPSNVMIDQDGSPHVMDFGLAKRDAGEITMTLEGQVLGTPAYMSPEQASGQVKWIDRRTDVYAIGVMLFQTLTGDLPFRGTAQSQIQQRLVDDAPSPRRLAPHTPLDLATVCLKCLERDPNRRYATAAELAGELRRWRRGEPVRARPLSAAGRLARWARRRPALASAAALGAILAIAGPAAAAVIYARGERIREQRDAYRDLLSNSESRIDAFSAEADRLRGVTGGRGPNHIGAGLPGWRRDLIDRLLADRGDALAAAADGIAPASLEAARARVALGYLYAGADRVDDAIAQLAAADAALRPLAEGDGAAPETRALYAECCDQLARLRSASAQPDVAADDARRAVAARRALAAGDAPAAAALVDLVEALAERRHLAGEGPDVRLDEVGIQRRVIDALDPDPNRLYDQALLLLDERPRD